MTEAQPESDRGGGLLLLLLGGAAGGLLLNAFGVPAGTLIGAVVGSAVVNRLVRPGKAPVRTARIRVVGLVLLGCAAGVRLDLHTLDVLLHLAVPLVLSVVGLMALDLALAAVLVRRYGIDPLTAVLACAPGGLSEIAVTAGQMGAQMGVVLSIHTVRVLAVVLILLPVLVTVLEAT